MLNRAYLSLGSNIEPERHLPAAVASLSKHGTIVAVSSVYQSRPVGFVQQPDFLNAALLLETRESAERLCRHVIPGIERVLGRLRDPQNKNAPRTIDIDLALFNREVLKVDHRSIPDPDIPHRPFLALPLAEIDPDYLHPQEQRGLREIAASICPPATPLIRRHDVQLTPATM